MGKEIKVIWKVMFMCATLLSILGMVFVLNSSTVMAEEAVSGEKELVQYSNNWTVFHYADDTGKPMFDVKYLDKTVEELEAENLLIQYRTIYQNYDEFELINSAWYDIDTVLSDEEQADIEENKHSYFIQFRVVDADDVSTGISMSDTFIIWQQEESFPYIISSSIDYCEVYDLETQPTKVQINLKFSEPLKRVHVGGIEQNTNISRDILSSDYSRKILSREKITETVIIEGKEYIIQYYFLSCEIQFPSLCHLEDISEVNIKYLFTFAGLVGETSEREPARLMLTVATPTLGTEFTPVESFVLSVPSPTLYPGDTMTLTADILPKYATNKKLIWDSSDPNWATVDENGVVTAKLSGVGKWVTITATSTDGSNIKDSYDIYIAGIPVTKIDINASAVSVNPGEEVKLSATVEPDNATNNSILWASSNSQYASVDSNGVVTTKLAGAGKTVTITATAKDGSGTKASIDINIKKTYVSKITLNPSNKTVKAGQKVDLNPIVTPSNATDSTIIWTSSNVKYAIVDDKGVVTTKKAGIGKTVTITAEAYDGSGVKAAVKIKIVKKVPVKKLKITGKKTVKAGSKLTLELTITPSNATNKSVKWTSSNKKCATVNAKGVVTAKKSGKGKTVKITATAKDGSKKKVTFKIKIK